jgi:hypothetical protein
VVDSRNTPNGPLVDHCQSQIRNTSTGQSATRRVTRGFSTDHSTSPIKGTYVVVVTARFGASNAFGGGNPPTIDTLSKQSCPTSHSTQWRHALTCEALLTGRNHHSGANAVITELGNELLGTPQFGKAKRRGRADPEAERLRGGFRENVSNA